MPQKRPFFGRECTKMSADRRLVIKSHKNTSLTIVGKKKEKTTLRRRYDGCTTTTAAAAAAATAAAATTTSFETATKSTVSATAYAC